MSFIVKTKDQYLHFKFVIILLCKVLLTVTVILIAFTVTSLSKVLKEYEAQFELIMRKL